MKRPSSQSFLLLAFGIALILLPVGIAFGGYGGLVLVANGDAVAPFDKSLVLIDHHNIDGAAGVIINKPLTPAQEAELPPFLRAAGVSVGYGGPIGFPDRIIVLEEKGGAAPKDALWFDLNDWDDVVAKTPDLLAKIRADAKQGGYHYRIFAGLAAWAPFQLEAETHVRNSWFTLRPTHALIFQTGDDVTWNKLFENEAARRKAAMERGA